ETHAVSDWPVRSFLALVNQISIRSSRYFAAPSRSQPADAARFSFGVPWRDVNPLIARPMSKTQQQTPPTRRIILSDTRQGPSADIIAVPFSDERTGVQIFHVLI